MWLSNTGFLTSALVTFWTGSFSAEGSCPALPDVYQHPLPLLPRWQYHLQLWQPKMFPNIAKCPPGRQNRPWLRITSLICEADQSRAACVIERMRRSEPTWPSTFPPLNPAPAPEAGTSSSPRSAASHTHTHNTRRTSHRNPQPPCLSLSFKA